MLKQQKTFVICLVIAACATSCVWLSSAYARANHTVGTGAAVACEGTMNPYMGACQDTKKQPLTDVPLLETLAMYSTFGLLAVVVLLVLHSRAKRS